MSTWARIAVAAAVALTGLMFMTSQPADASGPPPWDPDPHSLGSIALYDAAGNAVVSGSTLSSPLAAFAVAGGQTIDTGDHATAYLAMASPDGTMNTANYASETLGASASYPLSSGPSVVTGAGVSTPVVAGSAADVSIIRFQTDVPNTQTGAYAGVYQLRLMTPSTAGKTPTAEYFSLDIQVDDVAHTWHVVSASAAVTSSMATITPSKASPADHGSTVALSTAVTASDGSHPAGSVTWRDGSTVLPGGAFAAATGAATISVSPSDGAHTYSATFTPADHAITGAAAAPLPFVVNPQETTSVGLSVNPIAAPAYTTAALSATVTTNPPGGPPGGTMVFYDNGTEIPSSSVTHQDHDGASYTFTSTVGFSVGTHAFYARFTPSDQSAWGGATVSPSVGAGYSLPDTNPDCQLLKVTVDPGALTITTPYTPDNPFDLGHMMLAEDGTHLYATSQFGDRSALQSTQTMSAAMAIGDSTVKLASLTGIHVGQQALVQGFPTGSPAFPTNSIVVALDAATQQVTLSHGALAAVPATTLMTFSGDGGVTVTDMRAGDLPWAASVAATDFTGPAGARINAQNLSFTDVTPVYLPGNALSAATKPVVANDVTSSAGLHPLGGYGPAAVGTDGLAGPPKVFAHTSAGGAGTVLIDGTMTLIAPTTTEAGEYHGTVIFTVA